MPRIDMRKQHKLGMAAVLGLAGYCQTHLPRELYELMEVRASELNRCTYCIAMHTDALRKRGTSEERIDAAARGTLPSPLLDARENAALVLTEQLTRIDPDVGVSDEVWERAAQQFDEAELGNLVLGIATINVFNRINVATRLEA